MGTQGPAEEMEAPRTPSKGLQRNIRTLMEAPEITRKPDSGREGEEGIGGEEEEREGGVKEKKLFLFT